MTAALSVTFVCDKKDCNNVLTVVTLDIGVCTDLDLTTMLLAKHWDHSINSLTGEVMHFCPEHSEHLKQKLN